MLKLFTNVVTGRTYDENGDLLKGDHNISQAQEDIDALVEGEHYDVTIFFGDTRMATSLRDIDTGERMVGTQASAAVADAVLGGKDYTSQNVTINKQKYFVSYTPLHNPDDRMGLQLAKRPRLVAPGIRGAVAVIQIYRRQEVPVRKSRNAPSPLRIRRVDGGGRRHGELRSRRLVRAV